jgi:hypothetical protein
MLPRNPPSYEQSQRDARNEAAAAMLEDMQAQNQLPPPYDLPEREQYYFEMNQRMNEEIQRRQPQNIQPSAPPVEDFQRWYEEDLAQAQQQELLRQYQLTLQNEARFQELQHRIKNQELRERLAYQRAQALQCSFYSEPMLNDFLLMQFMMRDMPILIEYSWRLNLAVIEGIYHLGKIAIPAAIDLISSGINAAGSLIDSGSHSSSVNLDGCNGDSGKIIGTIIAVAVFLSAAIAAVFGGYYAAKKALASCTDLFSGKKILRSLVRIAGTLGGFAAGISGGLIVGGILGSMIPGFGNVAGAALGCIFGAFISAGLGAAGAKYGMRGISWLVNVNDQTIINPTNPNKYRLSQSQTRNLAANHVTDTRRIHSMMQSVKWKKPNKSFWPSKKEVQLNAEYNDLLSAIKTNPVVCERGVYLAKNSLFYWHVNTGEWNRKNLQRPPAYNPQYQRM